MSRISRITQASMTTSKDLFKIIYDAERQRSSTLSVPRVYNMNSWTDQKKIKTSEKMLIELGLDGTLFFN